MKSLVIVPSVVMLMVSCTVGPDFQLPQFFAGDSWKHADALKGAKLADDWWTLFRDDELSRLVTQAIDHNQDLAAGRARVKTAQALVGSDRARLFPVLELSGFGASERYSQDALGAQLPAGFQVPLERDRFRGTLDLSYDVDLWGRNRRSLESATARANSAMALHDAQRLGIAAEVVRQYYLLRGLERQTWVLKRTMETLQQGYDLRRDKAEAGMEDTLVVQQAKTQLELAKNDRAAVSRQLGAAEHALSVLCGLSPSEFSIKRRASLEVALPVIQPGLPANVLSRRPDVRAAEQALRAANAEIGVAEAGFYPNFSLSASGGYESLDISRFLNWQNRVMSLGAGVAAPLFRGGATRAGWKAAISRRDEALAEYKSSLLTALREVEDALVDLQGLAKSQQALEQALASATAANKTSRARYEQGLIDYLQVVDTDRTVLSIQLTLAQCQAQQRMGVAMLAKALGGGWGS